jgi:hypothetical protein
MDVRGKGLNEEQGLYSPPSYGQMIRRPCLRIARVAVSFALLITITASCTHTEDEGKPPAAKGVAIGPLMRSPGSSLLDVDGTDGSDIWAVGEVHAPNPNRERSLIEHWDGSSWGIVPAQDAGRLTSVSAIAADDAWALGDKALLHWDGATWSEVQLPVRKGAYFGSLSASGPDDVWIAGTRPGPFIGRHTRGLSTIVARFDGASWNVMHPLNPGSRDNYLEGLVALSPTDVWVAGYSGDRGRHAPEAISLTEHWDGNTWSVVPSPSPSPSLNVIWGAGSERDSGIWALGHYRAPDHHLHALVLRWDGARWDQIRMRGVSTWSPTSASGTSTRQVWVVGSEPTSSLAIAWCSVSSCRTLVEPGQSSDRIADSVYAVGPGEAWIVGDKSSASTGYGSRPFAERWDRTSWTEVSVPSGLPSDT